MDRSTKNYGLGCARENLPKYQAALASVLRSIGAVRESSILIDDRITPKWQARISVREVELLQQRGISRVVVQAVQ
jgi:hypothetical protein